jgi:hypothetical protein
LDANDVQKYYLLRDRWASVLLAAQAANDLISHIALVIYQGKKVLTHSW